MVFNELDNVVKLSLLYDFYGALLKDRQQEIMELYHEENFNIMEIASELGISKQGVFDALKKSENLLYSYEEKLGLVSKFLKTSDAISEIEKKINEIKKIDDKAIPILDEIKDIISKIED